MARYELSAGLTGEVGNQFLVMVGYEEEFYLAAEIESVRSFFIGLGFKKPLPFMFLQWRT